MESVLLHFEVEGNWMLVVMILESHFGEDIAIGKELTLRGIDVVISFILIDPFLICK